MWCGRGSFQIWAAECDIDEVEALAASYGLNVAGDAGIQQNILKPDKVKFFNMSTVKKEKTLFRNYLKTIWVLHPLLYDLYTYKLHTLSYL